MDASADLQICDVAMTPAGVQGRLISPVGSGLIHSPLLGRFNLMNLLQAVGVLLQQGFPCNGCWMPWGVSRCAGADGAGGAAGCGGGSIADGAGDYAHTPDGLDNALAAARPFATGQ